MHQELLSLGLPVVFLILRVDLLEAGHHYLVGLGRHRGGRGKDSLVGSCIKIRLGPFKGYKGRVVDVNGTTIRVELESQMKVVTVDRTHISDNVTVTTPYRYGSGSETPMYPSRTPLHPYMKPMRDPGATPIHDGMRMPKHDPAWNPYMPSSPPRDPWEDGNPGSWGTSPRYQPGSPRSRAYEAPTPGSGWANTRGGARIFDMRGQKNNMHFVLKSYIL